MSDMTNWQIIDDTTPRDTWLLLWFIGNNAPPAARMVTLGQISEYEPGFVWVGDTYRKMEWFSHWMPCPKGPENT